MVNLHFEGLVHLLRYIWDNKTLGFNYYADIEDSPSSDLFRQDNINTKNQLTALSGSSWKYFPDTGMSTGACIIIYQVRPIYNDTHVPGPVAQSGAESEYNAAYTAGMDLAHLRVLIHELMNKDPDIFPEEEAIIILYIKSALFMSNNVKDAKHTRKIYRRVHFVRNCETFKFLKIYWCEGGLKLACIATKNFIQNNLNPVTKYIMVILDN